MAFGQTAAAPATMPAPADQAQVDPAAQTYGQSATAAQGDSQEPVVIKVDPDTQQVLIVGNSTQIDQIDSLLDMIEDAYKTEDEAFVIKVYHLEFLNASSAAQTLEQVFNDAPVAAPPPQQRNQPGRQNQGQHSPQQVNQRDNQNGNGRQRGNNPQANQQRGRQQAMVAGKQRIRAIADLRVNNVIVRCNPADVTKVVNLLSTIDRPPQITQAFRILKIKNMKASELERIIKEVMHMGGTQGAAPRTPVRGRQAVAELRQNLIALDLGDGKAGSSATLSPGDTLTIASEDNSNTLCVGGPEDFLNVVETFVKRMEQSAEDNADTPRIFNLTRASAGEVTNMLQGLFSQSSSQGSGTIPVIQADETRNRILVSASGVDMAKIEKVVNMLDDDSAGHRSYRVIRLENVGSDEVQQMIEQIEGAGTTTTAGQSRVAYRPRPASYNNRNRGNNNQRRNVQRNRGQRRGRGSGGSAAEPPGPPSGDAANLDNLRNATGDASSARTTGPAEPTVPFTCEPTAWHAGHGCRAAPAFWAVPAILNSMMLTQAQPAETQQRAEDQPPGDQPPPAVEATPPPGGVPGPDASAGQAAPAESPVGGAIPLRPQTSPSEMIIPQQYESRAIRPAQSQPAIIQPSRAKPLPVLTPEQLEQIRSGNVRVTPVGPNEVIIEGPEESLDAMQALIQRMEEGAPPPTIVVIPLKNAQAKPLADQLNSMFQQLQPAGRTPRPEEKVTVIADPRSNSLIVAASPERLTEVENLIQNLDLKPIIGEVEYKVYPLKHIQAAEAATTLVDLLGKLQKQRGIQGDQFTITPDARTNSLIVTAPKGDLAQIESLIGTLDVPPAFATAEMMIYPLHNVLAKDLVTVLNDMISAEITRAAGGRGGRGGGGAASATETILRLKLKTVEGKELPELDLEKPIKIIAEPNTNSVVVSSTPDNLKAMNDVVKLLDAYPISEGVRVWVFALKYADATELAKTLTKMFDEGRSVGLRAPGKGATVPVVPGVPTSPAGKAMVFNTVVMADARTNTLVVAGRQDSLDLADQLVSKLDRPGLISKYPIHMVVLDNNDAATVAPLLEKLFTQQAGGSKALSDKVSIVAEPATNALLIAASPENYDILQGLVHKLDTVQEIKTLVREFPLQNADATQVADALKNLFSQGVFKKGGLGGPPGEKTAKVSIVAEPRTNTVIVSAKPEYWPLIETLIKRMDSPSSPFPLVGNFTVIPLHHTDAAKVASMLSDLLDQISKAKTATGAKVTTVPPVVIADPRTNSLLVSGTPATVQQVQTLVARLDQPSNMPSAEIRVYPLKEASPAQVEAIITDLFQRRAGAAGGRGAAGGAAAAATEMQVYADAGSSSLIVSASPEDHALIASLLPMLDVANRTAAQVRLFPLQKAQAATVVQVLESLYTMQGGAATGRGAAARAPSSGAGARAGGTTGVTFTADERTNSVVVRAAPADMRNVEELIQRLDTAEVQTEAGIRWVQAQAVGCYRYGENADGLPAGARYEWGKWLRGRWWKKRQRRDGGARLAVELQAADPARPGGAASPAAPGHSHYRRRANQFADRHGAK